MKEPLVLVFAAKCASIVSLNRFTFSAFNMQQNFVKFIRARELLLPRLQAGVFEINEENI